MRRKLTVALIGLGLSLVAWIAMAGYNPHILEVNLSIDGVADGLEFGTATELGGPGGLVIKDGWQKITLNYTVDNPPSKIRLNWNSSKIEVHKGMNGEGQITNDTIWEPASAMPAELWVKGVAVSDNGPSATVCGPEHLCLEAINNGTSYTAPLYDRIGFTVFDLIWPQGSSEPSENNTLGAWRITGLSCDKFKIAPDPIPLDVKWEISGFPDTPAKTKITWTPFAGNADIGSGSSPDLKVTYQDPANEYNDVMPPDNSWFGIKYVDVRVGGSPALYFWSIPVYAYFFVAEERVRKSDGKTIAAWYHYWKQGAVPALLQFDYVHNLGDGVAAQHTWTPVLWPFPGSPGYDTYEIAFTGGTGYAMKPVFDVGVGTYTEEFYPNGQGSGIHAAAKFCAHERMHGTVRHETRSTFNGGLGELDSDGDGLSDQRESEIHTNPDLKDTCNIAKFEEGGANYSGYSGTGDQELYCRWKQDGNLGDATKDWAFPGKQSYKKD